MREAARRDREMDDAGAEGEESANQWADERKNEAQVGYDADEAVNRWWVEIGEKEIGGLAESQSNRMSRM